MKGSMLKFALAGAAVVALPAGVSAQQGEGVIVVPPLAGVPSAAPGAVPAVQPVPVRTAPSWKVADARSLLLLIGGIDSEGLIPSDYDPQTLSAAIDAGEGAELDRTATRIFTWLIEDLRDGRTPMEARRQWFVVDPDADLLPTDKVMREALDARDIASVVQKLAPTNPDYAALRQALAETPKSNAKRVATIRANMDRWRWLARDLGSQYLITNVPEYQLRLTVNNENIRTYKTIVGKPGRTATPQLAEIVEGVVFNPTWTVPQSIVKGEGLGARVLNNPGWAKANGYTATRGANGYVSVVQQPGPGNSLGMMKLDMPNEHAIFLHDTPSRHLFNSEGRALSHGCIRTERALELAITMAILGKGASKDEAVAISTSGKYTKVALEKSFPVYITYFTMGRDINKELRTFSDIYGRDAPVLASFEKPRVSNRARETNEEVIVIEDDLRTT